jgi:hypothetical protein
VILRRSNNNYIDFDYNGDYEFEEAPVYTYNIHDEDFDEENHKDLHINDDFLVDNLDKNIEIKPQRKQRATTINKKRKLDTIYEIGSKVIYRKKNATVIYGPYERNYKFIYELQMEDGSIVSAIATSVKKA